MLNNSTVNSMVNDLQVAMQALPAGRVIVSDAAGIDVIEGLLWITDDSNQDFVLQPGEQHRACGRMVIEALAPARIAFTLHRQPAPQAA